MAVTPTSCSFLRETGWTCSTEGKFSHSSQNPETEKLNYCDSSHLEESIQDCNCEVQSLLQQLEPGVNLDQPVDQKRSHAFSDLITLHVVGSYSLLLLWRQTAMRTKYNTEQRESERRRG